MTLQDFFRMFSGAADGQRMTDEPVGAMNNLQPGILSQPTFTPAPQPQAQRPRAQPAAPAPVIDNRVSPQLPIESVNGPSLGPVASVMAGQDQPTEVRPQDMYAGPQQGPQGVLNMPQYEQGILSKIGDFAKKSLNDSKTGVSPLEYMFRGLGAAGSPDPMKAMAQFAAQDAEMQKNRAEARKAMMPKFTPLQGGAFTRVELPGQLPIDLPNAEIQKFIKDTSEAKSLSDLQRQLLVARDAVNNKNSVEVFQNTVKEAGGATTKAEFSPTVQRSLNQLDSIIGKLPAVNTTTLPGGITSQNPLLASVVDQASGAVGMGTEGFKVRRDLEKYFNEQVAADLKQLGANPTDTDLRFKQKPIPKAGDPIEYQIEYVREMRERLNDSETRRTGAAKKRDELSGSSNTAPAATPNPTAAPMAVPGLSPKASKYFN